MWYMHTMECNLALKRNKILKQSTTWISLGDITLSEIYVLKRTVSHSAVSDSLRPHGL